MVTTLQQLQLHALQRNENDELIRALVVLSWPLQWTEKMHPYSRKLITIHFRWAFMCKA